MLLWQEVIVSSCGDPIAVLEFRFGLCDESTVSVRNSMKIYGLLGLLVSLFSIGSLAEAQVITGSFPQNCPNCSSAVRFPSSPAPSTSTYTRGSHVVQAPTVYRDTSVVPATYVAPAPVIRSTVPTTVRTVGQPTRQASSSFTTNAGSGLAQSKAQRAANMGLRGHLGGGLGGAKYEGVGWSNQSAQSAIQSCCYWGTRPVSQIGVARGRDGCWYACVLYR